MSTLASRSWCSWQHGNRSPLADPKMRGMISGLALDDHLTDLAAKFNVTLEVGILGYTGDNADIRPSRSRRDTSWTR